MRKNLRSLALSIPKCSVWYLNHVALPPIPLIKKIIKIIISFIVFVVIKE
jgi:hypothetical protein